MIKPNELRIGNLIYSSKLELICPVQTVHQSHIDLKVDTGKVKCDFVTADLFNLEYIPLIPEWLERCGFESFNNQGCYARKIHAQGELMLFSTDSPVAQSNDFPPGKFYYMFSGVAHFIDHL